MDLLTAAKRRSLTRISSYYLNFSDEESDFTLSDLFSLALLFDHHLKKSGDVESDANGVRALYYKKACESLSQGLNVANFDLLMAYLTNLDAKESWNDFSDFKSVWYPHWFANQIALRKSLFNF
ncbi:MAG: hypothetical protein K2X39_02515, partial [Silvanigrellaceae bacterium]|nr:hypothetical protein [Silvanigrellaceae bacterium]